MALTEKEKMLYWLADCEAATLEHLVSLKSASKSEISRHTGICENLRAMLKCGYFTCRESNPEFVLNRLTSGIEKSKKRSGG